MKDLLKKYEQLKEEIQLHNYNYHALDDPKISDSEYDKLFRSLLDLEEENPQLVTPDSPTPVSYTHLTLPTSVPV